MELKLKGKVRKIEADQLTREKVHVLIGLFNTGTIQDIYLSEGMAEGLSFGQDVEITIRTVEA